jgi:hypothetical protein
LRPQERMFSQSFRKDEGRSRSWIWGCRGAGTGRGPARRLCELCRPCLYLCEKILRSRRTGLARQATAPVGKRCCGDAARHRRLYRVHRGNSWMAGLRPMTRGHSAHTTETAASAKLRGKLGELRANPLLALPRSAPNREIGHDDSRACRPQASPTTARPHLSPHAPPSHIQRDETLVRLPPAPSPAPPTTPRTHARPHPGAAAGSVLIWPDG